MEFPGGAQGVELTIVPYPVPISVHKGDQSGRIVATARPDASGRFRVELPPGTYTLTWGARLPARTVSVESGKHATVELFLHAF